MMSGKLINEANVTESGTADIRVYYGEVKWFNYKRNFGFIKSEDLDDEIFVHKKAVMKFDNKRVYLHKFDHVEFKLRKAEKGYEAFDVRKIAKIMFNSAPKEEKKIPEKAPVAARRTNFQAKCEHTLLNVAKALVDQQVKDSPKKNKNLKVNRFDLEHDTKISKEIKSLVKEIYLKQGVRVIALLIDPNESNLKTRILSINQKNLGFVDKNEKLTRASNSKKLKSGIDQEISQKQGIKREN